MKKESVILLLAGLAAVSAWWLQWSAVLLLVLAFLIGWFFTMLKNLNKWRDKALYQEKKYKQLAENATIGICIASPDRKMSFLSNQVLAMTGNLDLEERKGVFESLFPAFLQKIIAGHLNKQLQENVSEQTIQLEFHEEKWLEITSFLLYKRSEITGFHLIVKNITERKKVEKELERVKTINRESVFQIQRIIDATPLLIYIKDLEGKYLMVNKTFLHYTGRKNEEVIGKTIYEVYGHDAAFTKSYAEADARVIQTLRPLQLESVINGPAGRATITTLKFPFFDHQERLIGVAGISKDDTDVVNYRNLLEVQKKRAEEMEKHQEMIISGMTHEIRTPLNGIAGIAEKLAETPLEAEQASYVSQILDATRYSLSLAEEMIELSGLTKGKFVAAQAPICIRSMMEEVADLFQFAAAQKNISLHLVIHPSVPKTVMGDAARTAQVCRNVLSKAIRFTDKGYVQVEVKVEKQEFPTPVLDCAISSTGRVISANALESAPGWELTRKLTILLGGSLTLENKGEMGNVFRILLPLQLAEQRTE